jgi:DNA-binding XRE family transcriptional regulator
MLPDDPRHGTTAGHKAHRRDGEKACAPCVAAKTRYEKSRTVYGARMVPAIGTRRRIQALMAMGHSGTVIAQALGVTAQAVHKIETGTSPSVFAATAERVAEAYERLCMTLPTGYHRNRVRNRAARLGYAPPLAWDNIDDPGERPNRGSDTTVGGGLPWRELLDEWDFLRNVCSLSELDALGRLGVTSDAIRRAEKKRHAAELKESAA